MEDLLSLDLSFKALAIAAAVFFAIKAFVKGVFRQLWGMACLAAGAAAGYYTFINGSEWISPLIENPGGKVILGMSVGAGASVYGLLRSIVHAAFKKAEDIKDRSFGIRFLGSVASLAPTTFFVWVIASLLRLTGTVTELDYIDSGLAADEGAPAEQLPFWTTMRDELDSGMLGELLRKTSPIASDAAERLSALLLVRKDEDAWNRLTADSETAQVLQSPGVQRLLNDKDVLEKIAFGDHAALLSLEELDAVTEDPVLAKRLEEIDVDKKTDTVLYNDVPETGGGTKKKRRRNRFRPGGPGRR